MTNLLWVGAPTSTSHETSDCLVGDHGDSRGDASTSQGRDAFRRGVKRRAEDDPGPDPTPPKRKKIAGRSLRNPYAVLSNLLPRAPRPKKKATPKMSKVPQLIQCKTCRCHKLPEQFDFDAECDVSHLTSICFQCTKRHLVDALEYGQLEHINCPTCASPWSESYLRRFWDSVQENQYHELSKSHPHYRDCLNPDCSHGQIHISRPWNPQVRCDACGATSCFAHCVPWHIGFTCAQFYDALMEEREQQESSSSTVQDETGKTCRDCTMPLQKIPDSNVALECSSCGKKWCSECLADYTEVVRDGLHHHIVGCKYRTHAPWDDDGDVPAGLEQLRLSKHGSKPKATGASTSNTTGAPVVQMSTSAAGYGGLQPQSITAAPAPDPNHPTTVSQVFSNLPPTWSWTNSPLADPTSSTAPPATGYEPYAPDIPTDGDVPLDATLESELAGDEQNDN